MLFPTCVYNCEVYGEKWAQLRRVRVAVAPCTLRPAVAFQQVVACCTVADVRWFCADRATYPMNGTPLSFNEMNQMNMHAMLGY